MSSIRVPAGRSYRRPNTKFVDASPEKGIIEVIPDSGMVSLVWRNKETDRAEDELLIFPGEAVFERVKQDPTGRSWVLRFVESKQTHFFWLQSGTLGMPDARAVTDISELLKDGNYRLGSELVSDDVFPTPPGKVVTPAAEKSAPAAGSSSAAAGSSSAAAGSSSAAAGSSSAAAGSSKSGDAKDSKNESMAALLANWADAHLPLSEDASLVDILSPSTVGKLLDSDETLAPRLAQHLPPDLKLPDGADPKTKHGLMQVVGAPQFRDAVQSLEMALRNGMTPQSIMPWIQSEKSGVKGFVDALRKGHKKEEKKDDDKMDTD